MHRPAPTVAAALVASLPPPLPPVAPTPPRGLASRPAGGTPRAAAGQMKAMPAVQALYGSDALGALDELRHASDSLFALPAPLVPTSMWAAPSGAEKENAANDARSTATGELVPLDIAGNVQILGASLKPTLKSTSATMMPIKFASAPLPGLLEFEAKLSHFEAKVRRRSYARLRATGSGAEEDVLVRPIPIRAPLKCLLRTSQSS
ncbi:hypothetical protein T492DRAFT_113981 [Pavlovales sp. CCMP2436]|nr:hypothetical protein T492DRAFT_113981 [Pavlovales sp. CCMP2436]